MMVRKQKAAWSILVMLALLLVACGGATAPTNTPRSEPVVLDGAVTGRPQLVKFTAEW